MSENMWHNVSNLSSQFGENISFTCFRPFSNIISPAAQKRQKILTDCSKKISFLTEGGEGWRRVEENGGGWRRVEESGGEWRRVKESEGG